MRSEEEKLMEFVETEPQSISPLFPRPAHGVKAGFVECFYGPLNEADYGWHFAPWHPQRPFPKKLNRLCDILHYVLSPAIPKTVEVRVQLPPSFWEKAIVTVIAINGLKEWTFDEDKVNKVLPQVMGYINTLLEETAARRRGRR